MSLDGGLPRSALSLPLLPYPSTHFLIRLELHCTSNTDMQSDKIDFDIAGRENSFMSVGLEVEQVEADWLGDDWGTVSLPLCYT
jgi:hypothetical protein